MQLALFNDDQLAVSLKPTRKPSRARKVKLTPTCPLRVGKTVYRKWRITLGSEDTGYTVWQCSKEWWDGPGIKRYEIRDENFVRMEIDEHHVFFCQHDALRKFRAWYDAWCN